MEKSLTELSKEIHQIAVEHGWWDDTPSFGEIVALCHSELSEALEEYRAGRPLEWYECLDSGEPCEGEKCETWDPYTNKCSYNRAWKKPEGIAVEMMDCLIRILDWAASNNIDVDDIVRKKMEYNRTRPYRHGGKVL